MFKQNNPCKSCGMREMRCHSTCSLYIEYRHNIDNMAHVAAEAHCHNKLAKNPARFVSPILKSPKYHIPGKNI